MMFDIVVQVTIRKRLKSDHHRFFFIINVTLSSLQALLSTLSSLTSSARKKKEKADRHLAALGVDKWYTV